MGRGVFLFHVGGACFTRVRHAKGLHAPSPKLHILTRMRHSNQIFRGDQSRWEVNFTGSTMPSASNLLWHECWLFAVDNFLVQILIRERGARPRRGREIGNGNKKRTAKPAPTEILNTPLAAATVRHDIEGEWMEGPVNTDRPVVWCGSTCHDPAVSKLVTTRRFPTNRTSGFQ